jgi:hypothetical protein
MDQIWKAKKRSNGQTGEADEMSSSINQWKQKIYAGQLDISIQFAKVTTVPPVVRCLMT